MVVVVVLARMDEEGNAFGTSTNCNEVNSTVTVYNLSIRKLLMQLWRGRVDDWLAFLERVAGGKLIVVGGV